MELQFQKEKCPYLDTVVQEVQNQEQTLEIKLSDGMPDIGRVLCAWGQPLLRGKQWHADEVILSGGVQVRVLYLPEDGSRLRSAEGWVPFQMAWDLPQMAGEGSIRAELKLRFVDGRAVSARRILVRVGISAMAEAFCPRETEIYLPGQKPEGIELLRNTYPVMLPREAGEKQFSMDEELELSSDFPVAEKLLHYQAAPMVAEATVLGNKLVFRGNGKIHGVFVSEEGQVFSREFSLPCSQFAQLEGRYSEDAAADVILCVTGLEMTPNDTGGFRVKCELVAQYLVQDRTMLELVEDAYCPGWEMTVSRDVLELPVILETSEERIRVEQQLPLEEGILADVQYLTEFPRVQKTERGFVLSVPGSAQLLYQGQDGALQVSTVRWEGKKELPADPRVRISARSASAVAEISQERLLLEVPVFLEVVSTEGTPMVTGGVQGEKLPTDPQKPSIILRRAGELGLWELAKASGSTMEAIRSANALEDSPRPGQMLLIPVRG